jgi:hypothetical protein
MSDKPVDPALALLRAKAAEKLAEMQAKKEA